MPNIHEKPTGTSATTSTRGVGNVAANTKAELEAKLLKALRGSEGGAPLPPAQAKKALALAEALLARMDGAANAAAGAGGVDALDEKTRNELIVKTWSEEWRAALPKMSPAEHQKLAAEYAERIQKRQKEIAPNGEVARTLHRKGVFATTEAKFTVNPNIPKELQFGPFANPGSDMRAIVRLSNASGKAQGDGENDQRGIAIRLTDGSHVQDLMATNWPVSHAKDTDDFIAASALLKGILRGGPEFFTSMPPTDSVKMLAFLRKVLRPSDSMAAESFYSRSPFQLGDKLVEFRWVPVDPPAGSKGRGDNKLTDDMVQRHREGPIKWRLEMRGFLDEKTTPVHDGREAWNGPFITVGELEIPQKSNASREDSDKAITAVEDLGFSIGNRWDSDEKSLKGRGPLNEFREEVYAASHEGRGTSGAKAKACPMGFG